MSGFGKNGAEEASWPGRRREMSQRARLSCAQQHLQDLKKADQLMFCENCGRILYYNPSGKLRRRRDLEIASILSEEYASRRV